MLDTQVAYLQHDLYIFNHNLHQIKFGFHEKHDTKCFDQIKLSYFKITFKLNCVGKKTGFLFWLLFFFYKFVHPFIITESLPLTDFS